MNLKGKWQNSDTIDTALFLTYNTSCSCWPNQYTYHFCWIQPIKVMMMKPMMLSSRGGATCNHLGLSPSIGFRSIDLLVQWERLRGNDTKPQNLKDSGLLRKHSRLEPKKPPPAPPMLSRHSCFVFALSFSHIICTENNGYIYDHNPRGALQTETFIFANLHTLI